MNSHNARENSVQSPNPSKDHSEVSVPLKAWRKARRVVVFVVGGTLLLVGIALLVLPGPAFIVIPAGLAILAIEFRWARRWLRKARAFLPQTGAKNAGAHTQSQQSQGSCSQPTSNLRSCGTLPPQPEN